MKKICLFLFTFSLGTLHAQTAGDAFFSDGIVHEIRFNFTQPGYWDSLKQNYTLDVYMRCNLEVDGVQYPNSGVKFKGNSSYNNPSNKKPFRIDFSEYVDNQEVNGLKKLILNNAFKDPSFLREKLMLDFLNAHDISAPRGTFTRLYINNQYWGLYSAVEDVNKTFLEDRYGNKGGNLFKGDPKGLLTWKGAQQNLYETDYELKTNESENNWADLITLLNVLNNSSNQQLPDSLSRYMNLDSWYGYWAAHNLFVNLDSYIGSGHNYFIYHNTASDKFEWITWDVNEAFGNFQMGISLANIKTLSYSFIPQPNNQRPIMNRVWANTGLRQPYIERLCALLSDFSNEKMDSRIDALANLIRPYVYADSLKSYSNTQFEQNLSQDLILPNIPGASGIAGLKSFISARRSALLQQLSSLGCSNSNASNIAENQPVIIYPNPAKQQIQVISQEHLIASAQLYSTEGKLHLNQLADQPDTQLRVNLGALPAGMYFLVLTTVTGEKFKKALVVE